MKINLNQRSNNGILFGLALTLLISACARLPVNYPRTESYVLRETNDTWLGRSFVPLVKSHPGESGLYPLSSGIDAFTARMLLTDLATRSLDMQYYIWHGDNTGRLLLNRVLHAAERGVRVRLLLDDLGTAADDATLLAINAHRNVEIRLYNPVAHRTVRGLGVVSDFDRVNRRMHNKSFTADNQVSIVGGRNVGDEYFEARPDLDFADFDVMAVGPVVDEISDSFDHYWNSPAAFPIAALGGKPPDDDEIANRRAELDTFVKSRQDSTYVAEVRQSKLINSLAHGKLPIYWGAAALVYDSPDKTIPHDAEIEQQLLPEIKPVFAAAKQEVFVVSPYFVPGKEGVSFFRALRERGVQISIMTNSLASTDVPVVHAGYAKYRKPLLQAGVSLYEVSPSADYRGKKKAAKKKTIGSFGSSRMSLHAKAFVIDRRKIFVGSLNLDPRSVRINTENGIIFDNPELGLLLAERIEASMQKHCYRITIEDDGKLVWNGLDEGEAARYDTEPHTGVWQRFGVWLLSLLPIESQL